MIEIVNAAGRRISLDQLSLYTFGDEKVKWDHRQNFQAWRNEPWRLVDYNKQDLGITRTRAFEFVKNEPWSHFHMLSSQDQNGKCDPTTWVKTPWPFSSFNRMKQKTFTAQKDAGYPEYVARSLSRTALWLFASHSARSLFEKRRTVFSKVGNLFKALGQIPVKLHLTKTNIATRIGTATTDKVKEFMSDHPGLLQLVLQHAGPQIMVQEAERLLATGDIENAVKVITSARALEGSAGAIENVVKLKNEADTHRELLFKAEGNDDFYNENIHLADAEMKSIIDQLDEVSFFSLLTWAAFDLTLEKMQRWIQPVIADTIYDAGVWTGEEALYQGGQLKKTYWDAPADDEPSDEPRVPAAIS